MKIVAGMGSIDEYIRLVKAGADEVFCGYVPFEWNEKYGNILPLNRREVLYYNVQIGCLSDMKILKRMVDKYKVPVSIAFNSLYYIEEQYEIIAKMIKELQGIGFNDFIISDVGLLSYLKEEKVKCNIHLSGECAEINRLSMRFFDQFNISRYIFHRKNTFEDMKSCIEMERKDNKNIEFEAFIMNEKCHYTGAFCSSLHCDELIHLCKVPYIFGKKSIDSRRFKNVDSFLENFYKDENDNFEKDEEDAKGVNDEIYIPGYSGCGLCALKKLKNAGVTHLKVVGRGNFIEIIEKDIRFLKKSLQLVEEIKEDCEFEDTIRNKLLKGKCSKECYYY